MWRRDFNRHSQRAIRELLDGHASAVSFTPCRYEGVDIPHDAEHPIRVWTVPAGDDSWLVNGAWQINNQTLLEVRK